MASQPPPVFSREWGRRVAVAINDNEAYRRDAAAWHDTLGLEMEDAPPGYPSVAVLDLRNGTCHAVRTESEARPDDTTFLLRAGAADWQELLAGQLEPMWGIMSGRLRLVRGGVAALLPFAAAARSLVAAIATVETVFPAPADERQRQKGERL